MDTKTDLFTLRHTDAQSIDRKTKALDSQKVEMTDKQMFQTDRCYDRKIDVDVLDRQTYVLDRQIQWKINRCIRQTDEMKDEQMYFTDRCNDRHADELYRQMLWQKKTGVLDRKTNVQYRRTNRSTRQTNRSSWETDTTSNKQNH